MSTHTRATTVTRRRAAAPPPPAAPEVVAPTLSREAAALRHKAGGEIAALLRLAEVDAALLRRPQEQREAALRDAAAERKTLGARISRDVLDAYSKALRGGRQPAVARVVAGVCYGCFVRLHAKLEHHLRQQRGVGSCPHCLRVVYDPAWLTEPVREEIGRR
jgi:predicted  nucleic acid-binding Zn-ribbon protein